MICIDDRSLMAFTLKGEVGWESKPGETDPSQMLARSRKSIYFYISEKSGELNPRHSGGKPKHCILSYRTHADNRYINTTTYNSMVFGREKIT